MIELILSFEKEDTEMINELKKEFGNDIHYEENKGFSGLEIFITAVVPIAALSIQVIDFLLTHLHNDVTDNKKRLLITSDGDIDLRGYSEEEARKIIKCYFEMKNDK